MHNIKGDGIREMHRVELNKRRDPLDASSNRFVRVAGTCLTISNVILHRPIGELGNVNADRIIPTVGGDCWRVEGIVTSCDLTF